ncbi:MAG: acylphosphatase [Burkholderiales bacterium]|jgi:acylphosphatase
MSDSSICRHLIISGRVQGVGYRVNMVYEAERLGISGWVRNRRNGDVEAVVQGSPQAVAAIIDWARRGPSMAIVNGVRVEEVEGEFERFETRPTG